MAEFTVRDPHVDQLLTTMSIGYHNPLYIADTLAPQVGVRRQTGFIPQYVQSDWFRNTATARATGTRSQRGSFTLDQDTYAARRASFGVEIPDEVRDNTDEPYDMDRDGALFAADKVAMYREVSAAATLFTTGVWTGDQTGVASSPGANQFIQWDNYDTSTPLADLTDWSELIEGRIGRSATQITMGSQVWSKLKWHPDILDLIKYTQTAIVTPDLLTRLADIGKLLIGRGIYTTDPEGTLESSVAYTRIWGKHVLLQFQPERASMMTPAAAYSFTWQRVPNSLQYTRRMRDDEREVDIIEGNTYFQHKITVPRAGVFASGAVA